MAVSGKSALRLEPSGFVIQHALLGVLSFETCANAILLRLNRPTLAEASGFFTERGLREAAQIDESFYKFALV